MGRRHFIWPEDADVLTVGCTEMLLRTIRGEFRKPHWVVASARTLEEGVAYLQYNSAGVVVADASSTECDWREVVSNVKALNSAPVIIVAASTPEKAGEALRLGAYDVIERSLDASNILWTVASAWHQSMRLRGEITGEVRYVPMLE